MNAQAKRLHDEALALKPAGVEHARDLCPFCREEDVAQSQGTPSRSGGPDGSAATGPDASSEGGTRHPMSDISKETHEQLVAAAVAQAKAEAAAEIQKLTSERDSALADKAKVETTSTEQASKITTLTEENTRLNGELDSAQVALKASQDEVAELKQEVAKRDQAAQLKDVASKRLDQVKNLNLFPEDYAAKKVDEWAALSDEDWAARLDEYKNLRGDRSTSGGTTDTASVLTGTGTERGAEQDNASDDGKKLTEGRKATRSLLGIV